MLKHLRFEESIYKAEKIYKIIPKYIRKVGGKIVMSLLVSIVPLILFVLIITSILIVKKGREEFSGRGNEMNKKLLDDYVQ